VTPNVVPPGATVKVTFILPAKGSTGWWIFVNPGPGTGPLLGWDQVPLAGKVLITADGQLGWLSPWPARSWRDATAPWRWRHQPSLDRLKAVLDVTIPVDATIGRLLREVRRPAASDISACTESDFPLGTGLLRPAGSVSMASA
jgi:hypothetical protein